MDKFPVRVPLWKRIVSPPPKTGGTDPPLHRVVNWLPLVVFILLVCWFWTSHVFTIPHPPVGLYIGILAFMAGVVTIWPPDNSWSKAVWLLVFGGFLVLEITTLYKQQGEDQATAEANRKAEDRHFEDVLKQNQEDFDATMDGMKSVLTKQDQALLQTMGGAAYPLFLPVYPAVSSPNGIVLPVKVINNINTRGAPKKPLPLVDVSVDVSIAATRGNIQEAANSMLHSPHYNLGTIIPGVFETPIQLQPGRSYNLIITTRRNFFREFVNIESGKIGNWCMYQRFSRPTISEERLVDRGDGKSLTELCN